jgi:hypothetical protein
MNITESTNIDIDSILENENIHHKSESWNKLHKTTKLQVLHSFAEKYGIHHSLSAKEIRSLKQFLKESLEKKKLQKAKDIVYNKVKQEITEIPGLAFNQHTNSFTLRIDTKRVSTLSSLTPKRTTLKNQKTDENISEDV